MADIRTSLRELSVIYGFITHFDDLRKNRDYKNDFWFVIKDKISASVIKTKFGNPKSIDTIHGPIIDNGIILADEIVKAFSISSMPKIDWVGGLTQSESPADLIVNGIEISLKEDSFILENMGLYKLLNILTGSNHTRGNIHIFKRYAGECYRKWFDSTWSLLVSELETNKSVKIDTVGKDYKCGIDLKGEMLSLWYKSKKITSATDLPKTIDFDSFERETNPLIREKVFSKWINQNLSSNDLYITAKKECAITAGKNLLSELKKNLSMANIARLLRLRNNKYYYCKVNRKTAEIYEVPSISQFDKVFELSELNFSVPATQLNLLTTIKNKKTGATLSFRNELRFSHGQFNGTPEAKLYFDRDSSLENIYNKIN